MNTIKKLKEIRGNLRTSVREEARSGSEIEQIKKIANYYGFDARVLYSSVTLYSNKNKGSFAVFDYDENKIVKINYKIPRNINYNGFGPNDLASVDMNAVKNLSNDMLDFYQRLMQIENELINLEK